MLISNLLKVTIAEVTASLRPTVCIIIYDRNMDGDKENNQKNRKNNKKSEN